MDQQVLVEGARDGDQAAFTSLVQRYQEMALGYALAILGDFHLAQDVTQEALFAAYRGIQSLEDPARFPAWLRGIVRFQRSRVRRRRSADLVALDDVWEMPSAVAGPEQQVDVQEGFHRVLSAIQSLPASQQEVAMLFYIKDYSHREIAAFLDLPTTTVNNRLHAARTALRGRLRMNEKHGRVSRVRDILVDVQFAPEETPVILSGLRASSAGDSEGPVLQVVQHLGDGLVRCVARSVSEMAPGAGVVHHGEPLLTPLDPETLVRAMALLGASRKPDGQTALPGRDEEPGMVETGIKAIDLLCPLARGGTVGIFGANGNGRMVISAEVMRNLARERSGCTIFAFLHGELEGRALFDAPEEEPHAVGAGQIVFLPIENAIDDASDAVLAASPLLDARISLSFVLAWRGIWPAIDPLLSTSRQMDPAVIGQEHYALACAVRDLLRGERALLEAAPYGRPHDLTAGERLIIARARKAQRFFSQPFAVATAFTGRPGQIVTLVETMQAYKALLAGEYDALPEEAFAWRGGLPIV